MIAHQKAYGFVFWSRFKTKRDEAERLRLEDMAFEDLNAYYNAESTKFTAWQRFILRFGWRRGIPDSYRLLREVHQKRLDDEARIW